MSTTALALKAKIEAKQAQVGIIGLGYVGLPLAVEFARAGFNVTGIDTDVHRVDSVNRSESYISDVTAEQLGPLVESGRLRATGDFSVIAGLDAVSICVPTPWNKKNDRPDLLHVIEACNEISKCIHRGILVILESTTYPGCTDELVLSILEKPDLKVGEDFFLCFSPERVDPGNTEHTTQNIPKVMGGLTDECTDVGACLYGKALAEVVRVESARVAEMAKLLENTYRMVNISLVNEFARICYLLKINVWDVIKAAETKPFGFKPFYPGPGLGGHCIPIDPLYLAWKMQDMGEVAPLITEASKINGRMPAFVVHRIEEALEKQGRILSGARIHLMGAAYKPDVKDVRESPAIEIVSLLLKRGATPSFTDPGIKRIEVDGRIFTSCDPATALPHADCVVIVTDHTEFDYPVIFDLSRLILDTRNAFGRREYKSPKIVPM